MPKFEGTPIPPPEEPKKPEEISALPSQETADEFKKRNEAEAETVADAISQLEKDPEKKKETKSKIKRLALTLGLSAFVAGTTLFLARDKEVAEAEEAEIRSVEYEAERERAREILSEKLGMDLVEAAEKHGFTVHFKVDNGDGDYVVHIGQTHSMGGFVLPETRKSQEKIFNLVKQVSEKTGERPLIFSEDIAEEAMPGLETLRELYQKTGSTPDSEEVHKITGLPKALEDSMPARGAGLDLFIRNYIDIMPTTRDIEGQMDIKEALRSERRSYIEEISMLNADLDLGKISKEEFQKRWQDLERKMDENADKLLRSSFDDRESFAVESIAKHQSASGVNFIKYGDAHDFSEAIKIYNEQNPDKKLGLIKLSCPTGSEVSRKTFEKILNNWKQSLTPFTLE